MNNKNKEFNLFSLHWEIDKHPRSWICIKGKELKHIVKEMEDKIILERKISREELSKLLSKKLGCCFTSFKRILRGQSEYYPIPFIKEMVSLSNEKKYLKQIHSRIQFLKINSASSKEFLAVKGLNEYLVKILGAFMADGSLTVTIMFASKNRSKLKPIKKSLKNKNINYNQWFCKSREEHSISITINRNNHQSLNKIIKSNNNKVNVQSHHYLEITDEHKDNLEAFRIWIIDCFNILPNSFKEKKGAWRLIYSNKILARYLISFFDVKPGPKCDIAFEPEIIKNSSLEIRKLFARGVIMFDGCFSAGKITFTTISHKLFKSIKDILTKDGINTGSSINRGSYVLFTYEKNKKEKFMDYFEEGTLKRIKIKDLIEENNQDIKKLINRYKIYPNNKITFENLYYFIKNTGCCDWNYLATHFKCSRHILKPYLIVLVNNQLIKFSRTPKLLNERFVDKNMQILLKDELHDFVFEKIKEKFKTYENFSNKTNTHKATISAWKLRKNRIPLSFLKKMCKECEINFDNVLSNVQKTDRKIIEAI